MLDTASADRPRFVARPPGASPGAAPGGPAGASRADAARSIWAPDAPVAGTDAAAPPAVRRAGDAFGPLAPVIADPAVTDVFVNGAQVWVDRGAGLVRADDAELALEQSDARELAVRLLALGGRHIDEASPAVDARLADGIRVHAVLPPVSTSGPLLSVRLPRLERLTLADLDAQGFFAAVGIDRVRRLVDRRANVLISGAGGTGKTTMLAAMLARAAPTERIVVLEDVGELRIDHPHVVSLEARQANLEGAGEIGLARLVREALRMRPDRLVLGECRGAEVRELLAALNTGHDGGAGTIHANSLADVPARLEALGAIAGLGDVAVARQAVSAIDAVLHLERVGGRRSLVAAGRLELDGRGRLAIGELT
ncbi:TadA family conjugal transfer-associated ATPase [Galbitalea sp. SE-J8]|uniref:TadA family conjugal transfer-associated ATPase n=1 Tax=Galbitalea sp. SE-J8 TaxID=3054952 RepID=UPI00259C6B01|nr:TadA family conjugal transfer-associated ATPase [Galbitalea sp. SE-J8]MDM4763597.1 TadA family conjugal transfer-associated ATPase [Galbitalea sp. SE-J8]